MVIEDSQKQEVTPTPDPTRLTTDQLRREVGTTRELLDSKIDCIHHELEKLAEDVKIGLEHGRILRDEKFHALQTRVEDADRRYCKGLDDTSRQLTTVFEQKFVAIDSLMAMHARVNEVSERTSKEAVEKAFSASERAVQAALLSAEKAVAEQNRAFTAATAKSEATTAKQIDNIETLIDATVKALNDKIDAISPMIGATVKPLNDKIDDLRVRLTTIEGSGKGSKDLMAIIFTIAGICIAAIAAFIAFSKAG